MAVGFIAGYRGGVVDEVLSMLTNVVLVIPTLAVLIIVAAYLTVSGLVCGGPPDRRHVVAVGGAGDPRADVLARLARLRQPRAALGCQARLQVIVREIAPNMSSYLFLDVHPPLRRRDPHPPRRSTSSGSGRRNAMSLGLMMNNAVVNGALQLGMWWWFIPPGLAITAIVGGLYITNVGLDEVFNPKLRET